MTTATLIIVSWDRNSQPTWLQLETLISHKNLFLRQEQSTHMTTATLIIVSWDRNSQPTWLQPQLIIVSWDRNSQPTWLQLQLIIDLLRQKQSTHMTTATLIIVSWDRNSQPTWLQLQQSSSLETETVNPHDCLQQSSSLETESQPTWLQPHNHRLLRQKQSTHMTTATTIIVSWDRNSQPTWLQPHNHRLLRQKQSTHMTTSNHRLLRQKQSTHMTTATTIIVSWDRNSQPTWLQLQQSSSLETETVNPHDCSYNNHRLLRQKQSTHMTTATTIIVSWDRNSQPTWLQLQQSSSLETETVNPHDYSYNNHRLLRQKQSTHMTTATTIIVSWDRNSQPTWLQLQQSSSLETETVNPHDYSYNNHRLLRQKQSTHMTTATPIIVSWDRNSQPTWLQLQLIIVSWDRNSQPTWLQLQLIIVSWDRNSQPTWLQLQQSSSLETETVNPHDYSYNNHRLLRQKQSTHMTTATTIIVSWDRNSQPTWLQLQQSSSLETETVNPHDYSYNNHRLSRQKQSTHMTTATLIIVSWDRNSQPTWLQLQQSSSLETETVMISYNNHRLLRQKQSTHMTAATTIIVSWDRNSQPTWLQLQLIIVSWDRNSQPTWLQLQQSSSLETETVNPHDCSYNNHRLLRQKQSTHRGLRWRCSYNNHRLSETETSQPTWLQLHTNHRLSRQKQSTHMTTATLIIVSWDRNSQPTWLQRH